MDINTILLGIIAICIVFTTLYPWVVRWLNERLEARYDAAEREAEEWLRNEIAFIDQPCPSCGSRHVIQCDRSHFPIECTCKVCENEVTYHLPEGVQ
jgi:hypothetical protein